MSCQSAIGMLLWVFLSSTAQPVSSQLSGYYGLRKGCRDRFANYVTPVLELLGKADLEHGARNNRARFRAG